MRATAYFFAFLSYFSVSTTCLRLKPARFPSRGCCLPELPPTRRIGSRGWNTTVVGNASRPSKTLMTLRHNRPLPNAAWKHCNPARQPIAMQLDWELPLRRFPSKQQYAHSSFTPCSYPSPAHLGTTSTMRALEVETTKDGSRLASVIHSR